jgi:type VI secretion system protein ImpC
MPSHSKASQAQSGQRTVELSEFEALLNKEFKAKTAGATSAVAATVKTLAEWALSATTVISDDAVEAIRALIAEIDNKLSQQINLILHHEDFKALEGTWRGLAHLVNNTETDKKLKIRIFNISKKELGTTVDDFKGTGWDQSPLYRKLCVEEFNSFGGEPFGCILGDYFFDHTPRDIEILSGMAQIASEAHAPFIAGAAPSVLDMDSWLELGEPRDLTKIFQTSGYAAWRSLRDSEGSNYLVLTMPRFLSRLPYGFKTSPVEEFAFEEDTEVGDHSKYVWSNSAYALGANIARAFKLYGWCARIRGVESGGIVEGLPCHTFPTDDGGVDVKCPTEIAISIRREAELGMQGFMPLSHWKNTDWAAFIGAQSLRRPAIYSNSEATAQAELAARLPYVFAICRFVHCLRLMCRDQIGSRMARSDLEQWLNTWIRNYVVDPTASEEVRAKKPLSDARVTVDEVQGRPGYYKMTLYLRPHYQLEGLTASLSTTFGIKRVP